MAMDQGAPAQQAAAPEGQGQGGPPPIDEMVIALDQGLSQLAGLISQADPEAGQALAQLNEQYRAIMEGVVAKAQGGGGPAQGSQAPIDAQRGQGGVPNQF